jgi:hypothetical protein
VNGRTLCQDPRCAVPANAAKKRGRVAGLLAIGMGAVSLVIAAATPVYRGSPHIWVFGLIAAVLGVASILIGFGGVLYAGAKRRWLCNRVMTERLRQFHFQSFVCRWREIAASLAGAKAAKDYADQRPAWFHIFLATLPVRLDSELTDLLDDESPSKCWLHPLPRLPGPDEAVGGLNELFSAYRDLRIMHQIHYANHKLRSDQNIFSWSPRLQEVSFSYTILLCILAIFVIHLWIAFSILLDARIHGSEAFLFNYESAAVGIDVHVGVIWVAILRLSPSAHFKRASSRSERSSGTGTIAPVSEPFAIASTKHHRRPKNSR